MKYNHYNKNYAKQIDELYSNFNFNQIEDYIQLLKLIYNIYYNENIFIVIDINIKYNLNTIISYILNSVTEDIYVDNQFQRILNLINLIYKNTNDNNGFLINDELKKKLEMILLDNNIISDEDCLIHSDIYKVHYYLKNFNTQSIQRFFKGYGIDFNQTILNIKGIKIPNFLLYNKNNNMIDTDYEFLHLLFKIYGPLLYYGRVFQTGYEYEITDKDIVFDCGGNMGLFAVYCASKGATVYSFEPMSYIREYLKISQDLYKNKIHIIPYGIGNKESNDCFYQAINPGASRTQKNYYLENSVYLYKEKVKIITLDNFSKKYNIIPTFIKADIEGSEFDMLKGAKNIIKKQKPILNICLDHQIEDQYKIINLINHINKNYNYYIFYKGDIQSKFVLCK